LVLCFLDEPAHVLARSGAINWNCSRLFSALIRASRSVLYSSDASVETVAPSADTISQNVEGSIPVPPEAANGITEHHQLFEDSDPVPVFGYVLPTLRP
jgi:hypothetical protein